LDKGQRAILRRIMDPDDPTRHGSAKLAWVQPEGRKGRWMLSLSWTGEVEQASSDKPLIAGVHLGMTTGASIAYVEPNGVVRRRKDLFDLPKQTLRAAQRLRTERRERLRTNRDEFGLREGRGRQRKLRVASAVGEKISRLTDTACKQLAAAVVNQAKECGAVALGLEDLNRWSRDRAMDEAETKGSNRRAAEFRQWYFRWLQGTIRAAIKNAADREGLPVFEVDAAYDSRACHNCDTRYAEPVVKDGVTYGRWKWRGFRCTCGVDTHADRNAAINVARRTHEVWAEAQQEAAK
jgi:transposase